MSTIASATLIFAGVGDAVALTATEMPDPKLIPNVQAVASADRQQADKLVDQALPFVVAGEFDRSLPLLAEARSIYDQAWPKAEYLERPMVDEYALRLAALALPKDRGDEAELMARYAVALDFQHGRDETYSSFTGMDADPVSALGLILFRRGEADASRQLFRLLAQSSDYGVRENGARVLADEIERLKRAGGGSDAEAVARFAVDALDVPEMAQDRLFGELSATLSDLLRERGALEESAGVLQARASSGSVEDQYAAANEMDSMIVQLFRDRAEDRALALLAQVTGSDPHKLNLDAADKLDRLASQVNEAEQELRMRQLALAVYERDLDEKDGRLNRATGALGHTFLMLHRLDDAEQLFRRALTLSQRAGGVDSLGTIDDTRALAGVLRQLGRPAEAEALLRRVWSMTNLVGDYEESDYLRIATELTNVFLDQNRIQEADQLTADIEKRLAAAPELDWQVRVLHLTNRARVLLRMERHSDAETLLRTLLPLLPPPPQTKAGEVGDIDLSWGIREEVASLLANALEGQERFVEAEGIRRPFFENFSLTGSQARSTIERGTALAANLSRQNRNGDADSLFEQLAKAAMDVFGPASEQVARVSEAYALHMLTSGRPSRALGPARAALGARAQLQRHVSPSVGEATYLARMRQQRSAAWLFVRAALANQSVPIAELFEAFQRAEMTAAGAALARRAAQETALAAGAATEVRQWQAARSELSSLDARIAELAQLGGQGDSERLRLLAARAKVEDSLDVAERNLAGRYAPFFDLIASTPVALAQFQGSNGLLRSDEALVFLAPGSRELPERYRNGVVLVVTRESGAWAEVPIDASELEQEIYLLHQQLAAPGTGETDAPGQPAPAVRFERERAHKLYRALFGDPQVAALLERKERWTLAPQGALISLPFAALVTAPPPGGSAGDTQAAELRATSWLGLRRVLAVVPSVPSIAIQRTAAQSVPGQQSPFFGLGDPAFRGVPDPPLVAENADPETAPQASRAPRAMGNYFRGAGADLAALATLDRLPGTAGEVRMLAQALDALPGSVVLQLEATEEELRRRSIAGTLRRAQVVAFATHGLVGGELDGGIVEPALALTPPKLSDGVAPVATNDGLLTASEAASLNLAARWLILSACNTAAAGSANSEALSGLARAFLFAGAQSLLVSHFPIFDDAAPHLTAEAVRLSRTENLDPPSAMRAAMRRLVAIESNDAGGYSFAHPKAWAPFAVIDAR